MKRCFATPFRCGPKNYRNKPLIGVDIGQCSRRNSSQKSKAAGDCLVHDHATKFAESTEPQKDQVVVSFGAADSVGESLSRTAFRLLAAIALLLAPSVALAHPGHGED